MKTSVALLIFNRPEKTEEVFKVIRQVKPSKLLVVADGPRLEHSEESEKCAATRAIIDGVDWDCEVLKNYSDINLGCRKRVSSGLDWVFKTVEEAIILEDDCVPHAQFFDYCEEMLERYRYDSRIMSIAGLNVQFGRQRTQYSYYFSHYPHIWGWATWRRAWQYYDVNMKLWPTIKNSNLLKAILKDSHAIKYWSSLFDGVYEKQIDTWDYQWIFACLINNSLSIVPRVNLITNIGFGEGATHTINVSDSSKYSRMQSESLSFPLNHPPYMIRHLEADKFTLNTYYHTVWSEKLKWKLQRILQRQFLIKTNQILFKK
jgi:hypothetical protein